MYIPPEPVISPSVFLRETSRTSLIFPYSSYSPVFCSDGRSALYRALKLSRLSSGDTALIPAYVCQSVINVLREFKLNLKFYRVSENLEIDFDDLNTVAENAKVLLVIHYFGFPQRIKEIVRFCKERDILLIEDCAHALFSKLGERYLGTFGDYGFFSLRKSLPLFNGGILLISNNTSELHMSDYYFRGDNNSRFLEILPLLTKYFEFKLGFTPRTFLRKFSGIREKHIKHDSERKVIIGNSISRLSSKFLERIEENEIVDKRRNNYLYIQENFKGNNIKMLYTSLPDGVCPLYLPILINNRNKIRINLLKKGINLRMYWDILPQEVTASYYPVSHQIAGKILLLPVHQSLGKKHLDYILYSLKRVISRN